MPRRRRSDDLTPLILDFLEWIDRAPRPYAEVMDAWRTSCPRLTVWEDCIDRGLAEREHVAGRGAFIVPTEAGRALLARRYAVPPAASRMRRLASSAG